MLNLVEFVQKLVKIFQHERPCLHHHGRHRRSRMTRFLLLLKMYRRWIWPLCKKDVMRACSEHMPSVCEPYLSRRKGTDTKDYSNCFYERMDKVLCACKKRSNPCLGPNFEVIVGDAIEKMKSYRETGTKFDVIFGDLTDTPINEVKKEFWQRLPNLVTKL